MDRPTKKRKNNAGVAVSAATPAAIELYEALETASAPNLVALKNALLASGLLPPILGSGSEDECAPPDKALTFVLEHFGREGPQHIDVRSTYDSYTWRYKINEESPAMAKAVCVLVCVLAERCVREGYPLTTPHVGEYLGPLCSMWNALPCRAESSAELAHECSSDVLLHLYYATVGSSDVLFEGTCHADPRRKLWLSVLCAIKEELDPVWDATRARLEQTRPHTADDARLFHYLRNQA